MAHTGRRHETPRRPAFRRCGGPVGLHRQRRRRPERQRQRSPSPAAPRWARSIPHADRKKAGSFTGELLDGGKTSLAAAKGKIVVVNFWAAWCAPCRTETPQFDLLYRKIKSKGVDFIGIDTKDVKGNARAFVKENDISYPIVYDEQGETALRLGNIPQAALPFTVLIDKQGKVAGVYVIRLSTIDLQRSLDTLLAES